MPETRPRSLQDRLDLGGTRTAGGAQNGEGMAAKLERVAAGLGRSARSTAAVATGMLFISETATGGLSGSTDSVSQAFTLPAEGLWLFTLDYNITGGLSGATDGDDVQVSIGVDLASGAPVGASSFLFAHGSADVFNLPLTPTAIFDTNQYPPEDNPLDLEVSGFVSTTGTGSWSGSMGVRITGVRLAAATTTSDL